MYASLLTLLLLVQSGSATTAAQPRPTGENPANKNHAQALLREGTRLYRKGQYREALDRFSAAYALYPSPKLHFNIAQANRELGRPVEALYAFDKFLADPAGSPRPVTDEARRSAAELRAQLGQVQLHCDAADAEVLLDGSSVGRTPLPQPIWCTPGTHLLSLTREGFVPFEESVTVAAGGSARVSASLLRVKLETDPYQGTYAAPALAAGPPDRPALWPRLRRSWWFWGAVAAVAVGTGVALAAAVGHGSNVAPSSLGTQRAFP